MKLSIMYTLWACLIVAVLAMLVTKSYFPTYKLVEVTKEVVKTDIQTVTHTVTQPGGVIETTTTTIDRTQRTETSKNSTVVAKRSTINVSALVANDFSTGSLKPLYGVSVSKEVIGQITVGAFGLTNGTLGLSLGLNF